MSQKIIKYLLVFLAFTIATLYILITFNVIETDKKEDSVSYQGPVTATIPEDTPSGNDTNDSSSSTTPAEVDIPEGDTIAPDELILPEGVNFPIETNHFIINEVKTNAYQITLLAILNRPEQYNEYQTNLALYKQEATAYLQDNNLINTESIISYIPEEAEDL